MSALPIRAVAEHWVDVGAVGDVPVQGARRVETPAGPVAVFHTQAGEFYALADRCPHKGGPLSEGIVHGAAVACPLHDWSICLKTGQALGADAGKGCTAPFAVQVQDGRLLLRVAA